jgi:protein SCO1/2
MKPLFAVLALALLGAGCGRMVDRPAPAAAAAHMETKSAARSTVSATSSLYALHPKLVDQDGRAIQLDVFGGHPVLITMFYSSCRFACPMLISEVRRVEASLPPEERANLRVLLVSFDPERDHPAELRALADRMKLDTSRWRLATAPEGDVRALAAALDIQYRKLADGEFMHSSVITALGPDGIPVARQDGIGEPDDSVRDGLLSLR